MTPYLEYRDKRSHDLLLRFAPAQEFREIVDAVRSVRLPPLPLNQELAAFSVLELLSNSIRAHRERGIREEISLHYRLKGDILEIEILDAGRGFDPTRLPYTLEALPEKVDTTSVAFMEYRIKHGDGRFGMGLLAARRTFPVFSLSFVDKELQPCPWFSGFVRGTKIVLSSPLAPEAQIVELEELPLAEDAV